MDDDGGMLDCDDFEKTLKVCVVGNGNVGKTSLTTRYAKGRFTNNYKKTIGVDFMERVITIDGEDVHLMIWDTAGQEEFDTLTSRYYRGAGAVLYVFSTVDRDSFDALPSWQQKVKDECGSICQVLVQNKIDLVDDAVMTKAEVDDMKERLRVRLFRTSVQENHNVEEVFEHVVRKYLKKKTPDEDTSAAVADIGTLTNDAAAPSPTKKGKSKKAKQRAAENGDDEMAHHMEDDRRQPPRVVTKKATAADVTCFDDIRVAVPAADEGPVDDKDWEQDVDHNVHESPRGDEGSSQGGIEVIEPSKRRTNGKKKKKECIIS
ncbi:Aste57867_25295 [Aphanomyces stellatus]|uniref:Aste57867_25295 protein n=1 Tax=Aphanomyces stellatus TaxID=120398 RepID=A0A485LSV2_9STRA|nr:hypothetical protein As57867_025217 [Aphanomyces stellatus]VFU01920.1 Aste57867_25295 [Aphanomyces stellatus]